jgi:beta-N-acetylhexosaminidase
MNGSELMIVGFEGEALPPPLRERLEAGRAGGVVLFARNLGADVHAWSGLVGAIGEAAARHPGPPPIVALDQEGGRVQRLKQPLTVWPPMARLGARDDEALSEAVGRALGRELALFGVNVDFAPVLDVRSNPANQVIGDRAFAATPEAVARHALAFWRGLESAGVRGCGKHFPGHGDTLLDSHLDLPRIEAPLERLRAVELPPFAAAVRAGVGMIMTAHIVLSALDERPATLSPAWIDGVLRGELGFAGVVVSDDLDMKAMTDHFSVEEMVRGGLAAGVDAFLCCRDPELQAQAEAALARAAEDAALVPRVAAACARMHAFRETLRQPVPAEAAALAAALPDAAHRALADRL